MDNDDVLDDEEDGRSIDSLVSALYESMSFLPEDEPDWQRLQNLFMENAIFIAHVEDTFQPMDIQGFMAQSRLSLQQNGLLAKGKLLDHFQKKIL